MNITQAASPNDKNALGVTYETANVVGSRLRQAREQRRLSHSQVSARIKIRDRYIEAIEAGDWDVLPPGLNGRGLIRLYARELSVLIPEFESFQHLQTVRVERQSESLMSSSSKKSKYHPAAEESAEVIRSISRREFQKGTGMESQQDFSGTVSQSEDSPPQAKVFSRPTFAQRPHSNAIVTPNAYEVLGIEVEEQTSYQVHQEHPTNYNNYNETGLPRAEPVKRSIPENTYAVEPRVEVKYTEKEPIYHSRVENSFNNHEYRDELVQKKRSVDLAPMRVVLGLAFLAIFGFITLFLSSKNSSQTKVTTLSAKPIDSSISSEEALPNSVTESNVSTNKEIKAAEYPPQTQTVATGGMSISSQKVTNSMIIERTAKLNVTGKVNIVVEADGQQVFSGLHPIGVFEIPFKQKAEITISDASKASLSYEGWDHGPLGYSGRKRKIILNAQPYIE